MNKRHAGTWTACAAVLTVMLHPYPATAATDASANSGAATLDSVTLYRNNPERTGFTQKTLTTPLSLFWKFTSSASPDTPSSPVAQDGILYFACGPAVYAVRESDGSQVWKFAPSSDKDAKPFKNTPAIDDGFLYVGGDDYNFYKIDIKNGKQVWVFKAPYGIRSQPIVQGGLVLFGSEDGVCYALDIKTGEVAWSATTNGSVSAPPMMTSPSVVVFASSDNSLYAFNPLTGRNAWSVKLPTDPTHSPPIYSGNEIFVAADEYFFCLTGRTGATRWQTKLGSPVTTPLTYSHSSIFFGTQDNNIISLSDRGKIQWSTDIGYPTSAAPLLAGDTLFVPTQHGIVYALSASSGKILWNYVVQAAGTDKQPKLEFTDIASSPILVNGALYVLSDDGSLSAFRADATDHAPPLFSKFTPAPTTTVGGVRVPYSALIIDEGSGVNPASVSLSVDGSKVPPVEYDPSFNGAHVITHVDDPEDRVPHLADGPHQVILTASDWRGNKATTTWSFTVDNKLNPEDTKGYVPPTTTPNARQNRGQQNGGAAQPGGATGQTPGGGGNNNGGRATPGGGGVTNGGGGVAPTPKPKPTPTPTPNPPAGGGPPPPPL
ncbi:hypothetical protein CCAX7_46110 [Capsulimonas corticalis]|uniref:Pyrrolo-quinoline quinone repeat domain-containing protein n=1 Tax=Capsulimonas corticalis TaxID=2219043 RepID=A0A402D5B8_9BACT|nr:PQQ-binding-like beta-propeller repeat protein [Capsulimonas corticalis]BDI32560.1 hypothetical protein CCAX7_46110 [Capsulimonas corticalis]